MSLLEKNFDKRGSAKLKEWSIDAMADAMRIPVLAGRVELLLPMLSAPSSAASPSLRAALRKLHFDLAGAPVPELLSSLLQVADPNRIHYGSDWPFTPTHICEALLSALNNTPLLDEPLGNKVMSGNTRHLFPRLSQG